MNFNKKKKGFTIVELVIVLAVIGILAAILIPTFVNVVNKANEAKDKSLVYNLNEALILEEIDHNGKYATMHDTLQAMDKNQGFGIDRIRVKSKNSEVLWDSVNNRFVMVTTDKNNNKSYYNGTDDIDYPNSTVKEVDLWAISDTINPTYSTYYTGTAESVTTSKGFDAGNTNVNVTYDNETNQNVVIRTNGASSTLTIKDKSLGTIYHYGNAGALNIIQCHTSSYHEKGEVAFAEIATGRIVLEENSKVEHIHLSTSVVNNETVFNNITVAKAESVEMPEFSRDPVEIPEEGKLVVALQDGTKTTDKKDYVWLTAVGIYEQVTVSDSDEEAKDNFAATSETASDEQKTAAQQIANNISATVGGNEYTLTATTDDNGETWTYTLTIETNENITANVTVAVETVEEKTVVTVKVAGVAQETTQENGLTDEEKESAKTEVVNEAIESVEYAGVAVTKAGKATQLMTLEAFRDSVNNGSNDPDNPAFGGYAGYTVKLLDDINLNNVEWEPIGTSGHPFSGVFDGQGYKISNLKVNSTSGYAGLFGYIKGDMSNCPEKADLPENWDESSIAINEANYKAGVKELNIDYFDVKSSGGKKFCGTVVGYAEYAFLRDLTVSNGVVNNTDKSYAGGIVGGTSAGMAFENLIVLETVEVKAGDHSVGGIVGGTNNDASNNSSISGKEFLVIFSNCTNKANVSTTSSTGYAGGIVGHTQSGKTAVMIMNCYNRGEIKCQTLTGGIAGESDKVYMLFSCINYGKVWNDATSGNNFLGGITGKKASGSMRIIACINNGEVTGYANNSNIAGIIGSASSTTIEGCVNRGTITNTKATGVTHEITSGADNVLVANEATYTVDSTVSGEMTKVTITGGQVTCTSIVIDNEAIEKVYVAIDNFNGTITGLEGKTLYISGENSTVTIPGTAVEKVVVSGANCTIINNGTIGTIRFEVVGNNSIENNGTISNSANNSFTISSTVNGANVTITNNGTIKALGSEGAYALYFGSGAACVVNNQNGTITGNNFGKVTVNN